MKSMFLVAAASAFLMPLTALAQVAADSHGGAQGSMDPALFKPLPELPGVVSWKTLSLVQQVKQKDKIAPAFDKTVSSLDNKQVKVQGFMMPLEAGERQQHFILTSYPPSCAFCMPGGPEGVVEVRTKQPVKYTTEPIVVSGKLAVLKDDPTGMYYRLTDAAPVK